MCIPGIDPSGNPVADIMAGSAKRFLEELAAQAAETTAEMLRTLVAGWLSLPRAEIAQDSGPVAFLRAYTNWAVAAVAVGAVLIAAIRLAWERNGREAGSFARGLVMMVILAGAGVPAVRLLVEIGDAYSDWILDQSADGDLGQRLLMFSPSAAGSTLSGLTPIMVLGVSITLFFVALVQLLLLLAQNAGLVLLSGVLPLVGAVGISGSGRSVRDRYLTWLLAMILYKPTAATVYAAAFWMLGHGTDLMTLLTGIVMFAMALVALPALMRLLSPAISTLSSGGGTSAVGATAGTGAALASGAIRLSSAGSGSAGGRPGSAPPAGASPAPPAQGRPDADGAAAGAAASQGAAARGAAAGGGAAAAAAGPAGAAVAAGTAAAGTGPAVVRKVGGTAAGAVEGEGR